MRFSSETRPESLAFLIIFWIMQRPWESDMQTQQTSETRGEIWESILDSHNCYGVVMIAKCTLCLRGVRTVNNGHIIIHYATTVLHDVNTAVQYHTHTSAKPEKLIYVSQYNNTTVVLHDVTAALQYLPHTLDKSVTMSLGFSVQPSHFVPVWSSAMRGDLWLNSSALPWVYPLGLSLCIQNTKGTLNPFHSSLFCLTGSSDYFTHKAKSNSKENQHFHFGKERALQNFATTEIIVIYADIGWRHEERRISISAITVSWYE